MPTPIIIFSDFDGTIAQNDVGDLLFKVYGDWQECEKAIQQWLRDEISSRECLEREAATARFTQEQLDNFCDAQLLTPGFLEFAEFCRQQHFPLIVLSDGLDYYIQRILWRYGLDLPVYANRLEFFGSDRISVGFPYLAKSCGRCGNCKGYHIRRLAKPEEKIVYIGDGYSDRCGIQEAEIIFAKGDLAKWCDEHTIKYFCFENFENVLNCFKGKLLAV
ncbi:MAG: MtnX-like HAD-IB family phosphatase [candidate division KSB1 bacterium]|nr:MtnX-like HAD-IB family phosphatase [candidate division KSB1 bacterium]MDZ7301971.1 MtnX-like HAD-IB family phosphatase [candidate division KSB1 bacterium]MDZ7312376.1 MtnX-like HAD-IB family phosphatase [candidate division KSB1 bacterium]